VFPFTFTEMAPQYQNKRKNKIKKQKKSHTHKHTTESVECNSFTHSMCWNQQLVKKAHSAFVPVTQQDVSSVLPTGLINQTCDRLEWIGQQIGSITQKGVSEVTFSNHNGTVYFIHQLSISKHKKDI